MVAGANGDPMVGDGDPQSPLVLGRTPTRRTLEQALSDARSPVAKRPPPRTQDPPAGEPQTRTLEEINKALYVLEHKWGHADIWMQRLATTVEFNAGSLNNSIAMQTVESNTVKDEIAQMKKTLEENDSFIKNRSDEVYRNLKVSVPEHCDAMM